MNTETKKSTPAYTTFTSFENLISDLRENGLPDAITRSVVKGSNSGKATMLASLRSLNLIKKDGTPTKELKQLVDNEDDYSRFLKELLETQYPFLFDDSIEISNTTTEKVQQKFQDAGASGSTVSKGVAFFLAAAKKAGLEVSPRVKAPTPPRKKVSAKKKKRHVDSSGNGDSGGDDGGEDQIPEDMERITVPLRGMEDGIIYFPEGLDDDDARRAIRMTLFILKEFYGIDDVGQ